MARGLVTSTHSSSSSSRASSSFTTSFFPFLGASSSCVFPTFTFGTTRLAPTNTATIHGSCCTAYNTASMPHNRGTGGVSPTTIGDLLKSVDQDAHLYNWAPYRITLGMERPIDRVAIFINYGYNEKVAIPDTHPSSTREASGQVDAV